MIDPKKELNLENVNHHLEFLKGFTKKNTFHRETQIALESCVAAIARVTALCDSWIEEDEDHRRYAERWAESGGEPFAPVAYEDKRDCARAILTAIQGGAK